MTFTLPRLSNLLPLHTKNLFCLLQKEGREFLGVIGHTVSWLRSKCPTSSLKLSTQMRILYDVSMLIFFFFLWFFSVPVSSLTSVGHFCTSVVCCSSACQIHGMGDATGFSSLQLEMRHRAHSRYAMCALSLIAMCTHTGTTCSLRSFHPLSLRR